MLSKLYHLSLYDLAELLYGWAFGRTYWVQRRVSGPMITTTATTSTEHDTATFWLSPAPQWEKQHIRFRVPEIAIDGDY